MLGSVRNHSLICDFTGMNSRTNVRAGIQQNFVSGGQVCVYNVYLQYYVC